MSPSDDTPNTHVGDMGECLLLLKAPVQKPLLLAFQFPWKDGVGICPLHGPVKELYLIHLRGA